MSVENRRCMPQDRRSRIRWFMKRFSRHRRTCERCRHGIALSQIPTVSCGLKSPRVRTRARLAAQRRNPAFAWFYALPWAERNAIRLASNPFGSLTWEQFMAAWNYREARDDRRMARSLKRRKKVRHAL